MSSRWSWCIQKLTKHFFFCLACQEEAPLLNIMQYLYRNFITLNCICTSIQLRTVFIHTQKKRHRKYLKRPTNDGMKRKSIKTAKCQTYLYSVEHACDFFFFSLSMNRKYNSSHFPYLFPFELFNCMLACVRVCERVLVLFAKIPPTMSTLAISINCFVQ